MLDGDLKRVRDRRVLKTASWGEEQKPKRQQSSRAAGHNNHLLVDSHLTAWILLWTKTNLPFQHQHFLVKTFKGKAIIPQICGRMKWRISGQMATTQGCQKSLRRRLREASWLKLAALVRTEGLFCIDAGPTLPILSTCQCLKILNLGFKGIVEWYRNCTIKGFYLLWEWGSLGWRAETDKEEACKERF